MTILKSHETLSLRFYQYIISMAARGGGGGGGGGGDGESGTMSPQKRVCGYLS